nr:MAG TPA: hypothetical protein [Caudoviricetes sp.]
MLRYYCITLIAPAEVSTTIVTNYVTVFIIAYFLLIYRCDLGYITIIARRR